MQCRHVSRPLLISRTQWPILRSRTPTARLRTGSNFRSDDDSSTRSVSEAPVEDSFRRELFPEDAQGEAEKRPLNQGRHIPRIYLEEFSPSSSANQKPKKPQSRPEQGSKPKDHGAILAIYNASKSLNESDFKRIIPKSKHIEGWEFKWGRYDKGEDTSQSIGDCQRLLTRK
jgi:hypothetical protein